MTPVYTNRGFWWRNTISSTVLVVVAAYSLWELWHAVTGESADGYIFGLLFLGGAIWAGRELMNEVRDKVMELSRDPATGRTTVALWRPFRATRIEGDADALSNWRLHAAVPRRNVRAFYIYADHKNHPRPLVFDIRPGIDLAGLKEIAPEAVAEYGKAAGQPPP